MDLTPKYAEALAYAATIHADDARKGTDIPFIAHLIAVSGLVLEYGGSTNAAIAALLHDALEDAMDTEDSSSRALEIAGRFGTEVLSIVQGCTDGIPDRSGTKPPWRDRKDAYLGHLFEAPGDVLLVSCCDKLHNARAVLRDYREIGEQLWTRFNGGREGTLWYYRSLANTFDMVGQFRPVPPRALITELDEVVTQIEKLFGRVRLQELGAWPAPVPPRESDPAVVEIGWAEGVIGPGRPYRADCWAQDGITMVTALFSSIGIEDFTTQELCELLEEEQLIRFDSNPPQVSARKTFDAVNNPVWAVNIVIGDEDQVFARDSFGLRGYSA